MTSNYPEGMTSFDWAHVYGEKYAPDAPRSERVVFEDGVIYFDYTVLPDGPYGELALHVEVTGMLVPDTALDFERIRTFEDAESAQDWVYSFIDEDATYEQTKGAIKRGE